jgi:hypothetical protein
MAHGVCLLGAHQLRALAALATLSELKQTLARRLKRAQAIGDELESGMLAEELAMLTDAHKKLDAVLEGHLIG